MVAGYRKSAVCLGAVLDTSISGRRVARELTAIVERLVKLEMIVSDHGTGFTCNALVREPPARR
ncbi:hypothetical protein ACVIHH_008407 [Bradyrhizobium sp. USDA 4518]